MKQRLLICVALAVFAVTAPARAGRWIGAPCDPCEGVRQWIVTVDAPAEKVEALAWELLTPFKGWLRGLMGPEHKFVAELTEDQARSLLADPRVVLVDGRGSSGGTLSAAAESGTSQRTIGPYVYDGAGNITSIGPDQFGYDKLGRLTSATIHRGTNETWTQSYGYDRFGNRNALAKAVNGVPQSDTVVPVPDRSTNRLTGAGIVYDARGNLTQALGMTMQYDAENMIVRRTGGGVDEEYLYDAANERIATINRNSGEVRWTLRGLDGKVLSEATSQGVAGPPQWTRSYVWLGNQLIEAVTPEGTLHYHTDHLGTPRLITDGQGNVVSEHDFLPFGEEITDATSERLKFTGHEREQGASELNDIDYMHARYYNPNVGRFLSVDPGKDWNPKAPQRWNMYAYARNNPIVLIDPNGLEVYVFNNSATVSDASRLVDATIRKRVEAVGGHYFAQGEFNEQTIAAAASPDNDIILIGHTQHDAENQIVDFRVDDGTTLSFFVHSGLAGKLNPKSLSVLGCGSADICSVPANLQRVPGVFMKTGEQAPLVGRMLSLAGYLTKELAANKPITQEMAEAAKDKANSDSLFKTTVRKLEEIFVRER